MFFFFSKNNTLFIFFLNIFNVFIHALNYIIKTCSKHIILKTLIKHILNSNYV